jgi:hypothetical protein
VSEQETAFHEAGHAVAAHALGRQVKFICIDPDELGEDRLGIVEADPDLWPDIDDHVKGDPFRTPWVDPWLLQDPIRPWLRQEAIILRAGGAAAFRWNGGRPADPTEVASAEWNDTRLGVRVARLLGEGSLHGSTFSVDAAFAAAVSNAAKLLLNELWEISVVPLAERLQQQPVLEGTELQALLVAASPRGSHARVADEL